MVNPTIFSFVFFRCAGCVVMLARYSHIFHIFSVLLLSVVRRIFMKIIQTMTCLVRQPRTWTLNTLHTYVWLPLRFDISDGYLRNYVWSLKLHFVVGLRFDAHRKSAAGVKRFVCLCVWLRVLFAQCSCVFVRSILCSMGRVFFFVLPVLVHNSQAPYNNIINGVDHFCGRKSRCRTIVVFVLDLNSFEMWHDECVRIACECAT